MSDWLIKLRILRDLLLIAYAEWFEQIATKHLDDLYCCSGGSFPSDLCGCGGMTLRDLYTKEPTHD